MKQRFSSLDVKVIAHELSKTLCSLRVANIYDLSSRIFLFKFHKPDHREQVIVDSGFRCHLTSYARTTAKEPSSFVARLRKYLKSRRVTSISQIGTDRIIEFQFSDGLYRLYLEFYAGGNIVLTDGELKVLALLRNVEEGAEHEMLRVGLQYNLSLRQNYNGIPDLTKARVKEALQKAVDRQSEQPSTAKKGKKQTKDALRKALAVSITECPPLLVDHALHVAKFDSALKPEQVIGNDELLDQLLVALQHARKISEEITNSEPVKGYILAKPNPAAQNEAVEGTDKSQHLYDDFHPFRPEQFENKDYAFLEFEGFNKAVDEFFSSIEGQKLESRLHERELHAKKKMEQVRQEHQNRIGDLQEVQGLNYRKAEAILANVHRVTEAIDAVNGLIGQGMDWGEIARLIEREQSQANPVAQMIKLPLKLYENTITLLLDESSFESWQEEEDEGYDSSSVSEESDEDEADASATKKGSKSSQPTSSPQLAIDINLSLTAWANSTEYFDQKKTAAGKEERTVQSSSKALKSHERKVAEDLKKALNQEKEVLRPVRKQNWFEKFFFFLSSDGYLVLGGKDAQQNEILYRRYLRKGDIYVHAETRGAVPMIIKNNPNTPDAPIPPSTLSQAGHFSVCTSDAWDSKAVMAAWWVNSDQVSKTGSTGEYLPPGLFNIKGKKEFLPPVQLIVGLAAMFEISEESKAQHRKHRFVERAVPSTGVAPQKESADQGQIQDLNSDSEDDFPDARIGSDSDDDFPDAKMDQDPDDSDAESENADHSNPLQSAKANKNASALKFQVASKTPSTREGPDHSPSAEVVDESPSDINSTPESEQSQDKTGRRHLSARERRLLRKGQLSDPISAIPDAQPDAGADAALRDDDSGGADAKISMQDETRTLASQNSKAGGNSPLPRGKRGKAKKLAAKYADQDEEDRELAMRLLGSKSGQQTAEAEAQEKRAKEQEAQANKQRRREQHLRVQAMGKAAEEARRAAHEGNPPDDGGVDDEATNVSLLGLDAFTGRPLPGDEILSAMPVCAPWSALASFKYKVKLQPGALKRGKAVQEILRKWDNAGKDPRASDKHSQDVDRIWPKEIDLIRGWKEPEVVGILPVSKVRVMMAGGSGGGGAGNAGTKGKSKSARGGKGSKKKR